MENFIKVNIIEAKPVYSNSKNDEQLRELACGVTIVDPSNNKPINIYFNEESARILILGSLQYLGELGDSVAINMISSFMQDVNETLPETDSDIL